ncbi:MAG: bifunctional ADP-dependent NAD(P)H-hydrate dehydratase/NAD(P)H-hydrate epimerase [Spirochaetaceae bacterium]|jgi:NAD(P)H-hydrate epimerase|nr:bifunctional ADP-dependent NAD(P)H-hydrate dehydratase/NAD(P)H-hydrate epimerase [Spirochaetaceae bacterium]
MKGRGRKPALRNPSLSGQILLVSAAAARELDGEAARDWGLSPFALVEAAGRNCARCLVQWLDRRPRQWFGLFPSSFRVTALAGSGNNGADALVLLRALVLEHGLLPQNAAALLNRLPEPDENSPRAGAVRALQAMGIRVLPWEDGVESCASAYAEALLEAPRIIIDGIAGTGLSGPLRDLPLDMARAVNRAREASAGRAGEKNNACAGERPLVVSIDVPSGIGDGFKPGWPVVASDAVLAVEPAKLALYKPAARPFAGTILHVGGIFPAALVKKYSEAELVEWESARGRIPAVAPDAYKYTRGVAEIRAGSAGSAGAARIAAKGAQAAGAGLVRLAVDAALYPVLAASAGGIMVFEAGGGADDPGRFRPDALLLGPGWGGDPGRKEALEAAIRLEGDGTPLILDADAIALAKGRVFHGNTILTPHPGELANFAGVSREELADDPFSILRRVSREVNAVILFKTAVLIAAAPEGSGCRFAVIDGMAPVLGAGGSGDLLAGLCAGIAARARAQSFRAGAGVDAGTGAPVGAGGQAEASIDIFSCAVAAAALLVACAKEPASRRFADPLDLARTAAALAGDAWLPG